MPRSNANGGVRIELLLVMVAKRVILEQRTICFGVFVLQAVSLCVIQINEGSF